MSFDASWLTLREAADGRARNDALFDDAKRHIGPGAAILDLGCGTGATVRAFKARGVSDVDWQLLDNDPALLAHASQACPGAMTHEVDLVDVHALPLGGVHLVTASALLDLVSRDWVARLAERLADARIGLYAVLSYDGVMRWDPEDPDDAEVTRAFNAHQRSDKGFGPALGPDAGVCAADIFREYGFDVKTGQSPWHLSPQDAALHDALLSGITNAATEAGCEKAGRWFDRRRGEMATLRGEIGHTDLLAIPDGARSHG